MSKVIQSMFYNANYNLGYPDGQSKFIWGVQEIDFSKDIQKQLLGAQEVFNFNLTSLNPIFDPCHDENNLVEENQRLTAIAAKHEARADELYEALESTNKELYFLINELNKYRTKDVRCDQLDPPELHDMETCHLNAALLEKLRTEADGK